MLPAPPVRRSVRIGRLGRAAALLVAALLAAEGARAQTHFALRSMTTGRGQTQLGVGGLTGSPPQAIAARMGASVAVLDLNGDGFDDLAVGAPGLPSNPLGGVLDDAGHVFVLFGSAGAGLPGWPATASVPALQPGQGLDFSGIPGQRAGTSIAAAGDLDGDGFDDLLIGVPGHDAPGRTDAGGAYVIFGGPNLDDYPVTLVLPGFASGPDGVLLLGATALGTAGSAVGGGVDANNDGRADAVIGAPLASTNGLLQNGTASVVYGAASWPGQATVDLAALGAGAITRVHGAQNFQFMGQAVAGLGRFDPVLPFSGGAQDLVAGDDVALGAPGTQGAGGFFRGAVYVLRGVAAGVPALGYTTADFGPGSSAGLVYTGGDSGDQAGSFVASAGDLLSTGDGFVELLVGAPLDDGQGTTDVGAVFLLPGRRAGVDPTGLDLGLVGTPGVAASRILGPAILDGRLGVFAAPAGDVNLDGRPDLAVGFPNASVVVSPQVLAAAGQVHVLSGAAIDPLVDTTINLASDGAFARLMLLEGEAAAARAGSALASGDVNGDGDLDLLVGASGASSDPHPSDPTGIAFTKTGRSHLVFGPMSRVGSMAPAVGHFQGPQVALSVFNLPASGVTVSFGGVPAAIASLVPATETTSGSLVVDPPAPLVFGATVDVVVSTSLGVSELPAAFSYTPLAVATIDPTSVIVGLPVSVTGSAFSTVADMSVTIGGFPAEILASNPLAGTMTIEMPDGPPDDVPLDLVISSSNGLVTLVGALTLRPFAITNITPTSAPQSSGVDVPPGTPGISFLGQPAVQVTLTLEHPSGSAPPETQVYFGSDELVFKRAPPVSIAGNLVTVEAPALLVGQQDTLLDIMVVTDDGDEVLTDAFTYTGGDFREIFETGKAGFGASFPEAVAAGDFAPNGSTLVLFRGQPIPGTQFGAIIVGIELFDPFAPFLGGLLGPVPLQTILLAEPAFIPELPLQLNHNAGFGPAGAKVYLQYVTQESDGITTRWGLSPTLELTIGTL